MAHPSNTWQGKRYISFYDGHNRAAGAAAVKKTRRNKRGRRRGRAEGRDLLSKIASTRLLSFAANGGREEASA